jgi:hypothetical protein
MTLAGLDLNATSVRGVGGPSDAPPQALAWDEGDNELPTTIGLQERRPQVGRPGLAVLREYPHLVCHDFLASLGKARTWAGGRHRLDAERAVSLLFDRLRPPLAHTKAVALVLPAYLSNSQAATILTLSQKARLPVVGSTAAPLAWALAAYRTESWSGPAVLVDADDHALTLTTLKAGPEHMQVVESQPLRHLNLNMWKGRVLDAIAGWCVQHSRRDPRDSGAAEQRVYDQVDALFEAEQQDQMAEVIIQTTSWCQNLFLQPEQVRAFCAPLIDELVEEVGRALTTDAMDSPVGILVSAAVGRLPGLVSRLRDAAGDAIPVRVLPADAAARIAHDLAVRMNSHSVRHGHRETSLPLAAGSPADASDAATPRSGRRLAADR